MGKLKGNIRVGNSRLRYEDNIKGDFKIKVFGSGVE
jgi:hypothetical protein